MGLVITKKDVGKEFILDIGLKTSHRVVLVRHGKTNQFHLVENSLQMRFEVATHRLSRIKRKSDGI